MRGRTNVGCSRLGEAGEDKGRLREGRGRRGAWETKGPSMAKLLTTSRDTLLIWKWAIGQWAPIRARRRHIFTYACILRTCVCVFAPFFAHEIASNFKNGNSGVSHHVLLTLSSQSGSPLSRSRHAPFPRHAWAPPCETEKRKPIKFNSFSFSRCTISLNRIVTLHGTG